MNSPVKSFFDFIKLYESFENSDSNFKLTLLASNDAEKNNAFELLKTIKQTDMSKLETALDNAVSKGYSILSILKSAMNKREELDKGPLKKINGWYIGRGAWRLNSNKADYLGLTPKWMKWYDPKQNEIISKYFPELEKGDVQVSPEGELINFKFDDIDTKKVKSDNFEKSLVTSESTKYIKFINEQDEDFHLGPDPSVESEAVVITPNELIDELVENYKMEHRANVMIWGAPGIGKTELVYQAAERIANDIGQEICVMVVTLSQMQPYDLNGIPLLFSEKESEKTIYDLTQRGQIKMDFAVPAWLPGKGDMEQGILFFDEINRAAPDMLAAALSLLLDRKAQKYVMPDGWRIWAASNRALDTTALTSFEPAVASRFLGGHFHLVPTIDSWIEWARSDKGLYKGISSKEGNQFYIPDEFISFLRNYETSDINDKTFSKTSKFYDLSGKPIITKFKYFYDFDKSKLMSTQTGVQVGFPSPRNWAIGFKNVYSRILKKYEDLAPSTLVDSNKKAISMFSKALENIKDRNLIERILSSVVGRSAANAFIQYSLMLNRHNDESGTLSEKINNIFFNPTESRPFLNIEKIKDPSEIYAILSLVLSYVESLKDKYDEDAFLNWAKWAVEIVKTNKIKEGEATSHVSQILAFNPKVFAKAATKAKNDPNAAKIMKEFSETYMEIIQKFKNL